MRYIFYQTKTYYTNSGDALINNALITALREYGQIYANCERGVPKEFLAMLNLLPGEELFSDSEVDFVQKILKCALKHRKAGDEVYVFSGPGDMYGGSYRMILRNIASGGIFFILRLVGVKTVRIGRSVGPVSKLMAISEWFRALFLTHYYVRDTQSLQRCRDMGIKKVRMCPDLSWIYHKDHSRKINHTQCAMVNIRNAIFDDVEQSFIDATLQQCEKVLHGINDELEGCLKVYVAYQTAEEDTFSRTVYEHLRENFDVELVDSQMKLDEFEKYYGSVDYHISNRMHSLLAGYKYGSLPIALIDTKKHVKIAASLNDCGLSELMVDINETSVDTKAHTFVRNREILLRKIFVCEEENCIRFKRVFSEIFSCRNIEES